MLTLPQFREWLEAFKFSGTATWTNVTIDITHENRIRCLEDCRAHPADMQKWLQYWNFKDGREALALYTHMNSEYFGYRAVY